MGVSKNRGTPKSSILIGFGTIINYKPSILGGLPPLFLVQHPYEWNPATCQTNKMEPNDSPAGSVPGEFSEAKLMARSPSLKLTTSLPLLGCPGQEVRING